MKLGQVVSFNSLSDSYVITYNNIFKYGENTISLRDNGLEMIAIDIIFTLKITNKYLRI